MTYYKVTSDYGWSARGFLTPRAVKYPIGEFAYPKLKNSKLFVFGDLESALTFIDMGEEVYACEVQNPSKAKLCAKYSPDVEDFWRLKAAKKSVRKISMPTPKNTYFCDAVKLIKKVY